MKNVGESVRSIRQLHESGSEDVELLRTVILAIGAAYDSYAQQAGKDDEETQDAFAAKVRNVVKTPRILQGYIKRARKDRQATKAVGKAAAKLAKEEANDANA